jgi:hypothetical protein
MRARAWRGRRAVTGPAAARHGVTSHRDKEVA